jgi:outer membrane receptor protein involved in Fe transport
LGFQSSKGFVTAAIDPMTAIFTNFLYPNIINMRQFCCLLLFALLAGCGSAQQLSQRVNEDGAPRERKIPNTNKVDVNTAESGLDLTTYLRRIPGVQITGSGERATIQIRGNASAGAEYRPLYVVNGTVLGNDYSTVYTSIDPNEIESVQVLKTPAETSRYGSQGSSGVIYIKLRE